MSLAIDMGWIAAVWLVALRIGALLLLTPLFALGGVPVRVRVLLVLALSLTLIAALGPTAIAYHGSLGGLLVAAMTELVIGGLLAFGVFTAFASFQFAGRIMDTQLGFGVASLIDPSTRTPTPLLGTVLNFTALMAFFAIDGHHMIIRGIAFSLERIPPGTPLVDIDSAAVVAQFGSMFVYALMLAAPVVFVVLMVDIAMAVMARTMPQMNVFIVSLPLKIVVGLITLTISLHYLNPIMTRIFEALFDYWHTLLT
jgi:flagellar biosynthesis protein FliR